MKYFLFLSLSILFLQACSLTKAPEFKGITGIDIVKNKQNKLVLAANAKFYNSNLLGGKFKISDIKVFVNDQYLANLNSEIYKVPSKKKFTIPLEVDFDKSYLKKSNLLDVLNAVLHNKLKVQYKGFIYYVSHGLKVPYKVDYTQDMKL